MLYTVDGLKDDYANRSLVTAAVNDVLTLAPSRDLGEIGDLSEYGLDKPVAKAQGHLYRRQYLQLLGGRRVPRVPTARAISARRAQAPYMSQPWAISSMAPIYSLFAMTC